MDAGFVIARPIAHRGYHDRSAGRVENCRASFDAAIHAGYSIECDIQLSADGEAMVFHDFTLDRLTDGVGRVDHHGAAALRSVAFRDGADRMQTLGELFDQTAGRTPLVVEIKSRFDGDMRLAARAVEIAAGYAGPLAFMSFDPMVVAFLKRAAPDVPRGFVAQSRYDDADWAAMPVEMRRALAAFEHFPDTDPHFLSWKVADLPAAATVLYRSGLGRPVIAWTVRTADDRARAARHADQVTFEGYAA